MHALGAVGCEKILFWWCNKRVDRTQTTSIHTNATISFNTLFAHLKVRISIYHPLVLPIYILYFYILVCAYAPKLPNPTLW